MSGLVLLRDKRFQDALMAECSMHASFVTFSYHVGPSSKDRKPSGSAHFKAGQWVQALQLLSSAQAGRLRINMVALSAGISACEPRSLHCGLVCPFVRGTTASHGDNNSV